MEETTAKVHRHRHRRSSSRHNQERNTIRNQSNFTNTNADVVTSSNGEVLTTNRLRQATAATGSSAAAAETNPSVSNQGTVHTVVLVNGHAPNDEEGEKDDAGDGNAKQANRSNGKVTPAARPERTSTDDSTAPELTTIRRASETLSLREILQQHRSTTSPSASASTSHRRRANSPSVPQMEGSERHLHRAGIMGFMDKELKVSSAPLTTTTTMTSSSLGSALSVGAMKKMQSLSDPQASPAQRSTRSRSSLEKSPRRKRSKSESRRRRERKLIAAGEMEVRQANETLMKYLKQCSEMNDASLSGELEIDHNFDERRVHRKTKSQRDKRGHLLSKLYASGISSILKEISDDIVPADGEDIYNPFTPVVSPTEDTPAHIEKIFIQTSSGYRPVDRCYYKNSLSPGASGHNGDIVNISGFGGYSETRCFIESQSDGSNISSSLQLACIVQRIWILLSNICHGLLAGLALAHLLFVVMNHPLDWTKVAKNISPENADDNFKVDNKDYKSHQLEPMTVMEDYYLFAELYMSTFYSLSIICVVSVFDRMDICSLDIFHASHESISFRWIIISMIYLTTIILTICSNSIDRGLLFSMGANVTLTQNEMPNHQLHSVWNSFSMARSFCAILGWVLIGLTPHDDQLYENLVDMAKQQLSND